jgi:hypothetical protein
MHTDIHASSGIRTHEPSVRAGEDSSCLKPRGHRDRPIFCTVHFKYINKILFWLDAGKSLFSF